MISHNINYIRENIDSLDWRDIYVEVPYVLKIIRELKDEIDWEELCKRPISEQFIREFKEYIDPRFSSSFWRRVT